MNICFVSPYSSRGGAELSLIELIDSLQPYGFDCSCIVRENGAIVDLLADRGVEPIVVPFKPWVHTRSSFFKRLGKVLPHRQIASTVRLASAIKRSGCDLVYTNSVAVGAAAMAAKIAGKPHIWHLREFGHDDYQLAYDLGEKLSTFLMRNLSSAFIANSEAISQAYGKHLGNAETHVVYNAVELPRTVDIGQAKDAAGQWRHEGAVRCILLGKFLRGKGQEDAVRAMVQLRRMNVPVELLLVGETLDNSYFNQISDLIERHDLADRIRVLGHSDAPIPLMNSADIVLMCSRREAFGRVTVEGMKLGKPVIATNSGGTTEIIEDGLTGLLYEPGDSRDLAQKIAHLYQNNAERRQMGLAARCSAFARFNQAEYGARIASVLRQKLIAEGVASTASAPTPTNVGDQPKPSIISTRRLIAPDGQSNRIVSDDDHHADLRESVSQAPLAI